MYLELGIFLQAFILENQVFFNIICLICLHPEVSEMGLQFFENLIMSLRYCNSWQVDPIYKMSFLDNKIKYV